MELLTSCFHCGEDCTDKPISFAGHDFCCHGCQQIYLLLSDHSLNDYYTCEKPPGHIPSARNFSYLNNPAFYDRLILFTNHSISKSNFYLPSIHCRSCLYLLENLNKLDQGVMSSKLDFGKKELTVWFKESLINLGELANLLASIGYEPILDSEEIVGEKQKFSNQQKSLLIKMGVAGFCAGNIMLFSFPEYLGIDNGSFRQLFGFINVALGSVAVFYSGSDYFKNVWTHLKLGKITIEAPILLGIMVGYTRSVYEVLSKTGAGYMDSVSGLLFFLIVGKWFQQKSFDFLSFERKYTSYFPLVITKLIDGEQRMAPLQELKVGDHLLIRNQEIIPADSVLYKGSSQIDYSFVTGESEIVTMKEGNSIYAGGKHIGKMIEIEVKKDLKQSHLTQLWEHQIFKDPLFKSENWENFANKVGVYFTVGLLSLALLVGIYWFLWDPTKWQNAVVSILVIACPCSLAISYPFALGHGIRWLAKFNFYLKDIQALERMAQVDTIVFDKTGTLTLQLGELPKTYFNRVVKNEEWEHLYTIVQQSTHPISRQAQRFIAHLGHTSEISIENIQEITGMGLESTIDGVLYRVGSAKFVGFQTKAPTDFYRSETQLYIQIGGQILGYIEFPWENREGVELMLRKLQARYDVYLLSGDQKSNSANLLDWFPKEGHALFECSPMDKMKFIHELQQAGKKVAMVGDGLNDAGAFKQAHIGIAISDDHLHFTPSSDAILQGKSMIGLPAFFKFSNQGLNLIKISFLVSLVYNMIGLSFAIQGNLSPLVAAILMPLNSVSMLLLAQVGMNTLGKKLKNKLKSYPSRSICDSNHILKTDKIGILEN